MNSGNNDAEPSKAASKAKATAGKRKDVVNFNELPPLSRDKSFIGMTATQFLGAFNDNLYKQLLFLIAIDYKEIRNLDSDPYQFIALLAFSVPFVLLSGFAGFMSDKIRKRSIVVFCKVLEILVMIAAMIAFMTGTMGTSAFIISLMVVLFFMGAQSALFGPSKFGILPEMLREEDLPAANGIMQMTTFLAIILGTALSGVLKDSLGDNLWVISAICVCIAIAGTCTSLMIRRTPIANPEMKFSPDCLVVERRAWNFIKSDRQLVWTMIVYSMFWFAGAVVMTLVNSVCKTQLSFSDTLTSALSTCMGIGIATGCIVCAKWSKSRIRFDLVRKGSAGLFAATLLASIICVLPIANQVVHASLIGFSLLMIGFTAGIFAVPPQVFIQTRPPEDAKGRVIGAMNLATWLGIAFAGFYYFMFTWLLGKMNFAYSWTFVTVGLMFLAVAILFRIPNPELKSSEQMNLDAKVPAKSTEEDN